MGFVTKHPPVTYVYVWQKRDTGRTHSVVHEPSTPASTPSNNEVSF